MSAATGWRTLSATISTGLAPGFGLGGAGTQFSRKSTRYQLTGARGIAENTVDRGADLSFAAFLNLQVRESSIQS